MTKYRIVSNGYYSYLQYLYKYKFLGLWSRKVWRYIWVPYTGNMFRDSNLCISHSNVNILSHDVKGFAKRWPDIKEYFKFANTEQDKLDRKEQIEKNKVEKVKRKIIYL